MLTNLGRGGVFTSTHYPNSTHNFKISKKNKFETPIPHTIFKNKKNFFCYVDRYVLEFKLLLKGVVVM